MLTLTESGLYNAHKVIPGDEVIHYPELDQYEHQWSLSYLAKVYAFRNYEEIFGDFNNYLSYTPEEVNEIARGYRKGEAERRERLKASESKTKEDKLLNRT